MICFPLILRQSCKNVMPRYSTRPLRKVLRNDTSKTFTKRAMLPTSCEIVYCTEADECVSACQNIQSSIGNHPVVGFDAEWQPMFSKEDFNQIAVIQICTSFKKCYVFHLSHMGHLPFSLQEIITDRWVIKVGVSVGSDLVKIHEDFCIEKPINLKSYIDIAEYASSIGLCHPRKSLSCLTYKLLNINFRKNMKIQLSNWENYPLSDEQLEYASMDAFMSLLLFKSLEKRRVSSGLEISDIPYLSEKLS